MSDIEFLQESALRGPVEIIMTEHGASLAQALETVRKSHAFELLMDESTKLYRESPSYLYELYLEDTQEG